jgi:hypothetical protein
VTSITAYTLVTSALEDAIAVAGNAQTWARANGMSPQFVSDVRNGRKAPTDRLARALGFRRVVMFERI